MYKALVFISGKAQIIPINDVSSYFPGRKIRFTRGHKQWSFAIIAPGHGCKKPGFHNLGTLRPVYPSGHDNLISVFRVGDTESLEQIILRLVQSLNELSQ